jgi:hypothetical protein
LTKRHDLAQLTVEELTYEDPLFFSVDGSVDYAIIFSKSEM